MKTIKINYWREIPHNFTGKAEYENGIVLYLLNGKRHRLDGPARIWSDGYKEYLINDKIICNSGDKDYEQLFYNSKQYKLAKQQAILLENMKRIKNI